MIDHTRHIESVVKDELAKTCRLVGIDPGEAGWAIGGFGGLGVVMTDHGPEISARWTVALSLRPLLLGDMHRVAASVAVIGVLPRDESFRVIVRDLLPKVEAARKAELNGNDAKGGGGLMVPKAG